MPQPKNRALLAGSSFSALPILEALHAFGMHVTVAGNLKDDPCHLHGDASLYFDYSDQDALFNAAKDGNFDFIVPSCNDEAYTACAYAAHKLNMPGYDTPDVVDFIANKNTFRAYLSQNGFSVPRVHTDANPSMPVLVKPVDASGGKGITKVTNANDLPKAIELAQKKSRSGKIVIEEFFEGTLHSHSAFIKDKKIYAEFFVDEFCTVYAYQVNCSNHPSRLSDKLRVRVHDEMSRIITDRGLTDGLLHTQFMTNGTDIRIIESMRRCPGDLYSRLIEYATGFDHAAHYAAPFIGKPCPQPQVLSEKLMGRHTISVAAPMLAVDAVIDFPAKMVRFLPLKTAGQRLDPSPGDKFGLLFIEYKDRQEMLEKTEKLADFVTIHGGKLDA